MPEQSDVSPRGLAVGAAIVLGGVVASIGFSALLASRVTAPATGPSRGEPPKIEGPRLQTSPHEDLKAFEREKRERLSSYGRVDEGHMHIPIERAMGILAKGRER